MASRISRREWVRGLPSAFGVGRNDRKRAHSASERSVGYGFLIRESVRNHPNPHPYQTGSYVLKPRNVPHALCNTGTEPVWVMEILTPGGLESYFDEYEKIASKLASGEMDEEEHLRARAELGERYGVSWHEERIPEA